MMLDQFFFIEMPNRLQLSVFSELYYTYADNLIAQEACRIELARPPIDPYYTNAPISKDIAENQQKKLAMSVMPSIEMHFIKLSNIAMLIYFITA